MAELTYEEKLKRVKAEGARYFRNTKRMIEEYALRSNVRVNKRGRLEGLAD